jgi:hypothetical protein
MGIWRILRAAEAIREPVSATSSASFNPDVGRPSGWSSRRLLVLFERCRFQLYYSALAATCLYS